VSGQDSRLPKAWSKAVGVAWVEGRERAGAEAVARVVVRTLLTARGEDYEAEVSLRHTEEEACYAGRSRAAEDAWHAYEAVDIHTNWVGIAADIGASWAPSAAGSTAGIGDAASW
jgi:hypothetical protein